jgi:hypothetical protein
VRPTATIEPTLEAFAEVMDPGHEPTNDLAAGNAPAARRAS